MESFLYEFKHRSYLERHCLSKQKLFPFVQGKTGIEATRISNVAKEKSGNDDISTSLSSHTMTSKITVTLL